MCLINFKTLCMYAQTLRRLAQNREAARKSRLRKKVQWISPQEDNNNITSISKTVFVCFTHFRQDLLSRQGSLLYTNSSLICAYASVASLSRSSLSQAYVQQLESSRIKLNQLEQELQRARSTQVRNIPSYFFWHRIIVTYKWACDMHDMIYVNNVVAMKLQFKL